MSCLVNINVKTAKLFKVSMTDHARYFTVSCPRVSLSIIAIATSDCNINANDILILIVNLFKIQHIYWNNQSKREQMFTFVLGNRNEMGTNEYSC